MKIKKVLIALVLVLTMVSCTSIRVNFGHGFSFELSDYGLYFPYIDEYQLVSGSFPYLGDDMAFEAWTTVDEGGINLVAFLPTGQTFAKIGWNGNKLSYESSFMPEGRHFAQYIVSDLQMCYAPFDQLYLNMLQAGLTLTHVIVGNVETRILKQGNEIIEQFIIQPGYITVENVLLNYRYEIETL